LPTHGALIICSECTMCNVCTVKMKMKFVRWATSEPRRANASPYTASPSLSITAALLHDCRELFRTVSTLCTFTRPPAVPSFACRSGLREKPVIISLCYLTFGAAVTRPRGEGFQQSMIDNQLPKSLSSKSKAKSLQIRHFP
jgi:hypothetical protein